MLEYSSSEDEGGGGGDGTTATTTATTVDASSHQIIVKIDDDLIQYCSEVALTPTTIKTLTHLDLHLRESTKLGKIRKIENLNKYTGLRFINLSYNAITRIEGLDSLQSLIELNLAENWIQHIENLDKLVNLERLNISGNRIERISPHILTLKKLNMLRASRNKLKVLDDIALLGNLPKLTHFRMDENPISRHEHGHAFAVFCIPSLDVLDGHEVQEDDREEAREFFKHIKLDAMVENLISPLDSDQMASTPIPAGKHQLQGQDAAAPVGGEILAMNDRLEMLTSKLVSAEKEKILVNRTYENELRQAQRSQEQLKKEVESSKEDARKYREMMTHQQNQKARDLHDAGRDAILSAQYIRLNDEAMDMRQKMEELQNTLEAVTQSAMEKDDIINDYRVKAASALSPSHTNTHTVAAEATAESNNPNPNQRHPPPSFLNSNPMNATVPAPSRPMRGALHASNNHNREIYEKAKEGMDGSPRDSYDPDVPYLETTSDSSIGLGFDSNANNTTRYGATFNAQQHTTPTTYRYSRDREGETERFGGTGGTSGGSSSSRKKKTLLISDEQLLSMDGSDIEGSASKIIAHTIYDELQRQLDALENENIHTVPKSIVKEMSARASLRLVRTALLRTRKQEIAGSSKNTAVEVLPFDSLGEAANLIELIADTKLGLSSLQEAHALVNEREYLQSVVDDLHDSVASLESDINTKEGLVRDLTVNSDEAKQSARASLVELNEVSNRLSRSRKDLEKMETDYFVKQKEADSARQEIEELIALSNLESTTIGQLKQKKETCQFELKEWEEKVEKLKFTFQEEDRRHRTNRAQAMDQMRILHADHTKLQSEILAKQRVVEDLERTKGLKEDEIELKSRELDSSKNISDKEIQEYDRRVTAIRNDMKAEKITLEKLSAKRRHAEQELVHLLDTINHETSTKESDLAEVRSRYEVAERSTHEMEKRARELREKIQMLTSEQTSLSLHVADLKSMHNDQEKLLEQKKKDMNDNVVIAKSQMQTAMATAKQTMTMAEEKRSELEHVIYELQSSSRKLEENKLQLKEVDDNIRINRESYRDLELNRDRVKKDILRLKEEEMISKQSVSNLRLTIDSDTKAADETRRRLIELQSEEDQFRLAEHRVQKDQTQLRKQYEDMTKELDSLRVSCDRERRAFTEVAAKKQAMEAEVARCEVERQFVVDLIHEEKQRLQDATQITNSMRDEVTKLQQEVGSQQKLLVECKREEAEVSRSTTGVKIIDEKLRAEASSLQSTISSESKRLEETRKECTEVVNKLRHITEEYDKTSHKLKESKLEHENLRLQYEHLSSQRDVLLEEIERLRKVSRDEMHRTERGEDIYNNLNQRLKELRADVSKAEQNFYSLRGLSEEESAKAEEQRQLFLKAQTELKKIQTTAERTKFELDLDKRRAINDLGLLSQAKQNVQTQIFTVNEAQRRQHVASRDSMAEQHRWQGSSSYLSNDRASPVSPYDMRQVILENSVVGSNPRVEGQGGGGVYSEQQKFSDQRAFDANVLKYEMEKLKDKSQEVLRSVGITI